MRKEVVAALDEADFGVRDGSLQSCLRIPRVEQGITPANDGEDGHSESSELLIGQARDALTVKRVFGEPYEKDGVTIIPAARVQGGAGAGGGEDPQGQGKGSGSGFGMTARPVGAFIIRDGDLSWRPAVDVNRIILGGQVVAVVALLTVRAIIRSRSRAKR